MGKFFRTGRIFDLCLSGQRASIFVMSLEETTMGAATLPVLLSVMGFLALLLVYFMWARKVNEKAGDKK